MIIVRDTKFNENKDTAEEKREFIREDYARFYIERHPRPNHLITTILGEYEIRALELISLNNYTSVISKVIKKDDEELKDIIKNLRENKLVKNMGRNYLDKYACDRYEITPYGEKILNRELKQ